MKSIFLLGSATLAAGAGITIEVEKIAVDTSSDPEFGGCVANTVITSEEQCYAAALALRSAGELGADTIDHTNAPFPQLHPDHPTGGWATLPKGCSTWYDTQIHWNEGSGAGTADTLADNVRNSICLVHDPEVQHKVVGVNCKGMERIHGTAQCEAAAAELGISGTDAQVVTAADRPQGCSSDNDGLYWNDGDGSDWNSYWSDWNDGDDISSDHHFQAICTSGKVWKSANELADASCDELSQEYRDDTCCTNCVA
jgi:hypothetical protein